MISYFMTSPPNVMRTLDPSTAHTPSNNVESSGGSQGHKLSPAEERALQAEQRAASRQARCVSTLLYLIRPK